MSEPTSPPPGDTARTEPPRYVTDTGVVDVRRVTHDLRAPLTGVLGFAKLLLDGKGGPLGDKQRELVTDVLESGTALLRVVQRLEEEGVRAAPSGARA